MPSFTLPDLEGRCHSNSEYLGRILVGYIWSARCPECKRADNVLSTYKGSWPQDTVVLTIASNADEPREEIQDQLRAREMGTVLLDPAARLGDLCDASVTPFFLLCDRRGILRYRGALDDHTFRQRVARVNYVDHAIAAIREGKSPDPSETPGYGCALVRFARES